MRARSWRRLPVLAGIIAALGLATAGVELYGQQTPAPAKVQPPAQAMTAPEWAQVTVVRVKPEMLTEWQDFQKNETIPALQKGGVKGREAWQIAAFGEAYEYHFVTPIESLAQFDGDSPIVKALGQEGSRAYGAKARRLVAGSHTFGIQSRPDLSNRIPPTGPPKLAVVNFIHVAPGRLMDRENLIKSEILPAVKRANVPYLTYQVAYGGDPNEYVVVLPSDSFAEIGKGSPVVRALGGQDIYNKYLQKTAGIVTHVERIVMRYNADLSFRVTPSSEAR